MSINIEENIDEPDVIKLLERLITYALIRDEYRDFVKTNMFLV